MFIGCGIMVVGPERREDKPRGKGYIGIGFTFQRPKFMRRKETLKATSDNNSSSNTLHLSDVNTPKGSKLEWLLKKLPELLPQILESFDPHDIDFKQIREQCQTIRAEKRGKRSGALSPESETDEKLYKSSETTDKE
jgi:hypothetical protein